MITVYFPNWDTVYVLRGDVPHPAEGMVVLLMEVKNEAQTLKACATALYSTLTRCATYYNVECLRQHLPYLRRRLLGHIGDTEMDDRVDFLANLGWKAEYLLKTQMPFSKLKILLPLDRLQDLYSILSRTQEQLKDNSSFILNSMKIAQALRRQRHLDRSRQKGNSYFNAY
ncbi:E9 [Puffin papillomavirus 1]|uniref:E9 n=1 Tax=Puffin papillomavirus 1 TaxID=2562557 RepID=A0AAE5YMM0_9PAPI|nr:E9 [Puffin papillomavirus 1]